MLTNILAYEGDLDEARTVGKQALAVTSAQNDLSDFRGTGRPIFR
jgi:hypothetical protein